MPPPPASPKPRGRRDLPTGFASGGPGGRSAPRRYSGKGRGRGVAPLLGGLSLTPDIPLSPDTPLSPVGWEGDTGNCTPRRHPCPGRAGRASLPGGRASLPGGRTRVLPLQPPQTTATPRNDPPLQVLVLFPPPRGCRPRGAPDTRYLLTRGPEAAQPPGLRSRY